VCQGQALEYYAFEMMKNVFLQLQPTFYSSLSLYVLKGSACPESLQSNLLFVDIFCFLILDLAEKVCQGQALDTGRLVVMKNVLQQLQLIFTDSLILYI
jgi:hypothetical protein